MLSENVFCCLKSVSSYFNVFLIKCSEVNAKTDIFQYTKNGSFIMYLLEYKYEYFSDIKLSQGCYQVIQLFISVCVGGYASAKCVMWLKMSPVLRCCADGWVLVNGNQLSGSKLLFEENIHTQVLKHSSQLGNKLVPQIRPDSHLNLNFVRFEFCNLFHFGRFK